MPRRPITIAAALCCLWGVTAHADAAQPDAVQTLIRDYLDRVVVPFAGTSQVVTAVTTQNTQTRYLSISEIDTLDRTWRAEIGAIQSPLIDTVVTSPLADTLRQWIGQSDGLILEVFVMDLRGLNVAAGTPTSDYWQGDEIKHRETLETGYHIGPMSFDASIQRYTLEAAVAVFDPDTRSIIGAVGVELAPRIVLDGVRP